MKIHEISCGAYVIDNNKVLVVQHNAGHWDFPKGHIEKGENEQETAKREVFEETGIEIEIVSDKRYIIEYEPRVNVEKTVVFFEARKVGGELKKQEAEIKNVEWVDIKEIPFKITYEQSQNCFRDFMKDKGLIN